MSEWQIFLFKVLLYILLNKCFYCNSTDVKIKSFYKRTTSKRKTTRGKNLEIDRKEDKKYSEDNYTFISYWCNNAKSDVFSSDEFKSICLAIGSVIKYNCLKS